MVGNETWPQLKLLFTKRNRNQKWFVLTHFSLFISISAQCFPKLRNEIQLQYNATAGLLFLFPRDDYRNPNPLQSPVARRDGFQFTTARAGKVQIINVVLIARGRTVIRAHFAEERRKKKRKGKRCAR